MLEQWRPVSPPQMPEQEHEWRPLLRNVMRSPLAPPAPAQSELTCPAAEPLAVFSQSPAAMPVAPAEPETVVAPHTTEILPVDENGQLTSVGSLLHEKGLCRPCLFLKTPIGCRMGVNCKFCHIWHKAGDSRRPCKAKRDRYKSLVARVMSTSIRPV
mmetsp:Transcript_65647/g.166492  ORF Transcript_65647/g.166492 Transcript_65647/m.166492 type:complete len:157 (-) Transcript_65647:18-488(-)